MRKRERVRLVVVGKGKKYHHLWCEHVVTADESPRDVARSTIQTEGLKPCLSCKPSPPLRSVS